MGLTATEIVLAGLTSGAGEAYRDVAADIVHELREAGLLKENVL